MNLLVSMKYKTCRSETTCFGKKGNVCKTAKLWKKKLSFAGPKSVFRQSKAFLTFYVAFTANFFTAHLFKPFQFCSLWCNLVQFLMYLFNSTSNRLQRNTFQLLQSYSSIPCNPFGCAVCNLILDSILSFYSVPAQLFSVFVPSQMSSSKTQFSLSKLSTCSLSYKSVFLRAKLVKSRSELYVRSIISWLYTFSFSCSFCHLYTKISTYVDNQYLMHKTGILSLHPSWESL